MSQPSESTTNSEARAVQEIKALPGVVDAEVSIETTTDGLTKHRAIAVDVSAPEAQKSDEAISALIDKILPVAWSVGDVRPDQGIILRLRTDPQVAVGPIAKAAGWENVGFPSNQKVLDKIKYQATFSSKDLDAKLGKWPLRQ